MLVLLGSEAQDCGALDVLIKAAAVGRISSAALVQAFRSAADVLISVKLGFIAKALTQYATGYHTSHHISSLHLSHVGHSVQQASTSPSRCTLHLQQYFDQ